MKHFLPQAKNVKRDRGACRYREPSADTVNRPLSQWDR